MKEVFWVIPQQLAGRPGPDLVPWQAMHLRRGGIGAVLSVNEGTRVIPQELDACGIHYARFSLADTAPPEPQHFELCCAVLPQAYEFARHQIAAGNATLVHCTAGKDRTGLFLGYFLGREYGLTASEAIREVKRYRPIALSALGWDEFGLRVLDSLLRKDAGAGT